MEKGTDTRQTLINEGLKSIILKGYDGVGLGTILSAARVPKGSFYYFFDSKEDFVGAVLESYQAHYGQMREAIFGDQALSPLQRLQTYFEELERLHRQEEPLGGCLYGVLAQTASARGEGLRGQLAAVFETWEGQLQAVLAEAQAAGEVAADLDPREAAAFLIEAYEGALIRMKVDGGTAAFERFKRLAFRAIAA